MSPTKVMITLKLKKLYAYDITTKFGKMQPYEWA